MFKKTLIALRVVSALCVPICLFFAWGAYMAGDAFSCALLSFFAGKMVAVAATGF